VTFTGGEPPETVLSGFTITNGSTTSYGGGICGSGPGGYSHATIANCRIVGNDATKGGGLYGCAGLVTRCLVAGNSAGNGGGLADCFNRVANCVIGGNFGVAGGGGIYSCDATIDNCTIVGNSTAVGPGGGINDCSGTISDCIIWSNTAPSDSQVSYSPNLTYSCIQDWLAGGTGNIVANPLFVDADGSDDDPATWADNDYHLLPNSPCINGGDPGGDYSGQLDMDGEPRVLYGRVDMGADEVTPIAGDFEPDGDVDLDDYAALEAAMNGPNQPPGDPAADLDADGDCDLGDFTVFAHNFTGLFSDFDDDGDVDLDDYAVFVSAMNGPNQPPGDPAADLDGDNDCDLNDLSIFMLNFTGSL